MRSVPRLLRFTNVATLVALLVGGNGPSPLHASELLRLTHGVASGDITATDAVVWARANRAARMVVEYTPVGAPTRPPARRDGPSVTAVDDFTGKVVLTGLTPDTRYLYWVRNFGVLRIGADGLLTVEVRGLDGAVAADDRGRMGALTLTPQR